MGYSIIRSIGIKSDKVMGSVACSNCRPITFSYEEFPRLTRILNTEGYQACVKDILYWYFTGEFQQGNNDYNVAVKLAKMRRDNDARDRYNWDTMDDETAKAEWQEIMWQCFIELKNAPKGRFCIRNGDYTIYSVTSKHIKSSRQEYGGRRGKFKEWKSALHAEVAKQYMDVRDVNELEVYNRDYDEQRLVA